MGWIKSAFVFTTVKIPLGVLGVKTLKNNNEFIRDVWRTIAAPTCPECGTGGLHCDIKQQAEAEPGKQPLYPWYCSNKRCEFVLLAPNSEAAVKQITQAKAIANGRTRVFGLREEDRERLISGHINASRLFWACAVFLFFFMLYRITSGAPVLGIINIGIFAIAASLVALKRSYRAWQVETGTVFKEGAFARFVVNGRWVR